MSKYKVTHTTELIEPTKEHSLIKESVSLTKEVLQKFNKFINNVTSTYSAACKIDKSELFGEANLALVQAYNSFDLQKSASFEAYARFIIVDALNEYVRKNKAIVTVPRYVARGNNLVKRLKKEFGNEADFELLIEGRYTGKISTKAATDLDLLRAAAKRAGTDTKEFIERVQFLPVSCDDTTITSSGSMATEDVQKTIITKVLVDQLHDKFSKQETQIAKMLMEDMPISSISETLGISRRAVTDKIESMRKKAQKLLT